MSNKSSVSKSSSYQAIGEFWDEHDASEFGAHRAAEFTVNIHSEQRYYPINKEFSSIIRQTAREHGVTGETLINLWVQEKISQIRNTQKSEPNAPSVA